MTARRHRHAEHTGAVLELELTPGPASLAREEIVTMLALALEDDVPVSADAGSFHPAPLGVLVGLPELVGRGMATRTYTVPVLVVSSDPLNSMLAVDRLYAVADAAALALATDNYRPSSWAGSVNAETIPALELTVTITIEEV